MSAARAMWIGLLTLAVTAAASAAPLVMAGGDQQQVWIIRQLEPNLFTVLHRRLSDPPYVMRRACDLTGRLAPGGLAAGDQRLWLVYQNGLAVHAMSSRLHVAEPGQPQFNSPRMVCPLPAQVALRSLSASRHGLWALVSVRDAQTLAQLDQPPAEEAQDPPPATTQAATVEETFAPVDRLLVMEHHRWVNVPLPEDWSQPQSVGAWVLSLHEEDRHPLLVQADRGGTIATFHRSDAAAPWTRRDHLLPAAHDVEIRPLAVEGQLVMAVPVAGQGKLAVDLWVLRPEAVTSLGQLQVAGESDWGWAVSAAASKVALIALSPKGELFWTAADLRGQAVEPAAPLQLHSINALQLDPRRLLVMAVLTVAMVIMFWIWRRDPLSNRLALPRDLALCDPVRRVAALAVDLLPGLLVASAVSDVPLGDLLDHWPGVASKWPKMLPGTLAIAVCIAHCSVSEALGGRSLGKMLFAMRVTTLDGKPPGLWQALARNLLKAFDLTVFYILPVLVLVGPYRQRLGDLLARTVVVVQIDPDQRQEDTPGDFD